MIGRMLYILGSDGDCEGFVRWIIVWKQKLVIYAAYREDEKYKGFFEWDRDFSSSLYAS
jgi:deoxyribodipyrimidine photolyase-like uncharacterized protein